MPNVKKIADNILESTIVASFSKAGFAARDRMFGLDTPTTRLDGQRALVTGATSGIGNAVARGLLELGAEVIVTSRDLDRAKAAAEELADATGGNAHGMALDTADFESVHELATTIRDGDPLSILCHNAGALTDEYQTSEYDMELTLASHLVGPHALTMQLKGHLTRGARVIFMSSGGMYSQKLDLESLEMSKSDYRGAIAYARAKRAQVELVTHLGPKWAPDVILSAMHPGWVDTPGVEKGLPGFGKIAGPILRSAEQGADTMVWLAAGGGDDTPGAFWLDRRTRSTNYLPWTKVSDVERSKLIDWLDLQILPAIASSL